MAAVLATVRGRVQGVGFRAFVTRTAHTFGVFGEVWNAMDGSVGVFAQHEDEHHLEAFVRMLHEGPGWVQSVDSMPAVEREVEEFAIGLGR